MRMWGLIFAASSSTKFGCGRNGTERVAEGGRGKHEMGLSDGQAAASSVSIAVQRSRPGGVERPA